MTGLQEAFYIVGIVFMGIMLVLIAALVVAVFVIRAKIIALERKITARVEAVADIAGKSGEILAAVGSRVVKKAARKVKRR